jgi:rubrerythrin
MPVLTPTKLTGATAVANEMLYVDPARETTPDELAAQMPDIGLNAAFVADLMSAMLAHERCGTHLYRSVAQRSNNPMLQQKYEELGAETLHHVEVLEGLIAQMGGDPNYVSANARAVETTDSKLLEATFMGSGALDPMTAEMAMLDVVFIAESVDHANWQLLAQLTASMPAGDLRAAFQQAVDEVEAQEDEHLGWARDTKARLVKLQAESELATTIGLKVEEVVARVRAWLT